MKSHGTVLGRQVIYSGRVFSVNVDRVRMPASQTVEIEVVRHPGSVVLIAQPDPEHIVLVNQYRYTIDRWIWELPAGRIEPGETPETAAKRECEEEIGLVAGAVTLLGTYYPTPGFCDEQMMFFRLSSLETPMKDQKPAEKDPDEDLEVATLTLSDARAMVRRGDIMDLKTTWGLTLAGMSPLPEGKR